MVKSGKQSFDERQLKTAVIHRYTRILVNGLLQLVYLCMWIVYAPLDPQRRFSGKLQYNGDQFFHGWRSKIPPENSKDHQKNPEPGLAR